MGHTISNGAAIVLFVLLVCPAPAVAQPTVGVPGYPDQGWDPGLSRKCAKSADVEQRPNPVLEPPYEVTDQCMAPPNDHLRWTVSVWSAKTYDPNEYCGGCFNLADTTTSMWLDWLWLENDWTVQLFSNFATKTHPGGAGYFNWYMFGDSNPHPATFPTPDRIASYYALWYNTWIPDANSAVRLIPNGDFWWCEGPDPEAGLPHTIEMNVLKEGYGDLHPDPRVLVALSLVPPDSYDFLSLDGAAYGMTISKSSESEPLARTPLLVDWSLVIDDLLNGGDTPLLVGRYPRQDCPPAAVSTAIGYETHNYTETNAVVANLRIRDAATLKKASLNELIPASSTASAAAADSYKARDLDASTAWISGGAAPQSLTFDLGAEYTLTRLRLLTYQVATPQPPGANAFLHRVLVGPALDALAEVKTFQAYTVDNQWLDWVPTQPVYSVRYLRIETVTSPFVVGWREVQLTGKFTGRVRPYTVSVTGEYPGWGRELAFDGNPSTSWNSGGFPTQSITLDLGKTYTLKKVRAQTNQIATHYTQHTLSGGLSLASLQPLHTFSGPTSNLDWLEYSPAEVLEGIRYLRLETTQSDAWVAWREIEVRKY